MEDYLEYTKEGLLNRVMFLSSTNEINIFVEDRNKEYEYQSIFERLLGSEILVKKVFAVGGKLEVEKAYREYGDVYDNRKNFYIVDGDFDLLLEKAMIDSPNYIYLQRYNIESYYVDKNAALLYMAGKMKKVKEEVDTEICYDEWSKDTYSKLERLFLAYAVAQMELPGECNVGISEHTYLDEEGAISIEKVSTYENRLKERIVDYNSKLDLCQRKYKEVLNADSAKLICGKYILCSLAQYLRKKTRKNFKEDDFKYFMLSMFDISCLDFVKHRITALM